MVSKKWLGAGLLLLVTVLPSQAVTTYFHSTGYCAAPDRQTVTQGVKSSGVVKTADVAPYTPTGAVLAIYPSCTVNIYIQGTLLPPVGGLFSDRNGTPLSNPFTATATGVVSFYVSTAASYDIVLSGTVSPVFTYSDVAVGSAGGGGGGTGDASSLNGVPITGSPVTGNLLEFDGANWTPFAPIWCQLTGCTLTGPLTLSGDPAFNLQAATKSYVDTQTAGKASLVGGFVPTAQLGSGTADGTKVLKGDHTWGTAGGAGTGGCGTTGFVNAVNIGAPGCAPVTDAQVDGTIVKSTQIGQANGVPAMDSNQDVIAPHDVKVTHQIQVTGPFYQTTPIPVTPMACPPIGNSAFGIDSDGDFKKCINGASVVPFGGTALSINGGAAQAISNLNGTTPVAQAGNELCTEQISGTSVSVQCPSLNLSTGGQGGVFLPFDTPFTAQSGAGVVLSAVANQMSFAQVTFKEKITVGHVNVSISTASAGQTFTVALYSSDGLTKLFDMGAFSCTGTGAKVAIIGSPPVIPRGVYLMAWGASDNVCAAISMASATIHALVNQSASKRLGTAANAYAAGPPATLGALTATTIGFPIVYVEP